MKKKQILEIIVKREVSHLVEIRSKYKCPYRHFGFFGLILNFQ